MSILFQHSAERRVQHGVQHSVERHFLYIISIFM